MIAKIYFTILLFSLSIISFGQTGMINQLDSADKKHGNWTMYLDYYWKEAKDSSKAVYYRYNYYDHGTKTTTYGQRGFKGWKFEPASDTVGQNCKPKLLDGEYKSFDKNGQLRIIQVLDKGEYVSYKSFNKSGELLLVMDWTKKWKNKPHSYLIESYKKGKKTCYFVTNGSSGWASYESDCPAGLDVR